MHTQRTPETHSSRGTRPRVARRYSTCAEALQAVGELETLAEDEVSHLRNEGREAEADARADAWRREIARALGEAKALQRAVTQPDPAHTPGYPDRRSRRVPQRALSTAPRPTLAALCLIGVVGLARLIDAIAPELLTLATILLAFAFFSRSVQRRRGVGRRVR